MASVTAGVLLSALAGCGGASSARPAAAGTKALAVIKAAQNSAIMQPGLAFLYIGSYLGYDKQAGIRVQVVQTQGPADALQRLAAGRVDVALPPPAAILTAAAKGHSLGVITPFMLRRHGEYAFSVLPGSPIRSYRQIPGKRVGVTNLNNEGVQFTQYTLATLGKPRSDVHLLAVGNTGQAAAELEQHHVDALAIPTVQLAEIMGPLHVKLRVLPNPPFEDQVVGNAVWFNKSFLQSHPKLVQSYLTAFTKSLVFFLTNPRAALEIFFTMFPQAIPNGKTLQQAVDFYLPTLQPNLPTFRPTKTCPQYGCNEKAAWNLYVRYLGISPKAVGPVTQYYTNRFIKAVNQNLNAVVAQAKSFKLK